MTGEEILRCAHVGVSRKRLVFPLRDRVRAEEAPRFPRTQRRGDLDHTLERSSWSCLRVGRGWMRGVLLPDEADAVDR
jgi:hypothetical protein